MICGPQTLPYQSIFRRKILICFHWYNGPKTTALAPSSPTKGPCKKTCVPQQLGLEGDVMPWALSDVSSNLSSY